MAACNSMLGPSHGGQVAVGDDQAGVRGLGTGGKNARAAQSGEILPGRTVMLGHIDA